MIVAPTQMGGLETVVAELLSAAQCQARADMQQPATECAKEQKRRIVLTCYALLEPGAPLPTAFATAAAQGALIVRIDARHRAYREHYSLLRVALLRGQAHVVHSHGYHADVISALLARSLSVPHVSTLHGFVGSTRRGRFYEWLQLTSLRRAAAVIAVSETVAGKSRTHGVTSSRIHVIPNSAPSGEPLGRENARELLALHGKSAPTLGWIGRMSDEKDPLAFVALVREMCATQVPVWGVMIGDGALMSQVCSAGADLIDSGKLVISGAKPDAGRLLCAFDALLLTSSTEGTPMVALEAMRAGVPVVSTAVGGVPVMLAPDCGVLVPYGNTTEMARAVSGLLNDATQVAHIVSQARLRVRERYSRDEWWSTHVQLYQRVATAHPMNRVR